MVLQWVRGTHLTPREVHHLYQEIKAWVEYTVHDRDEMEHGRPRARNRREAGGQGMIRWVALFVGVASAVCLYFLWEQWDWWIRVLAALAILVNLRVAVPAWEGADHGRS